MNAVTIFTILINSGVPHQDAETMVCIAYEESKFDPKAINHKYNKNGTKDYGLFQINSIWLKECSMDKDLLLLPRANIGCAIYVYQKQGLKAWSTLRKCDESKNYNNKKS